MKSLQLPWIQTKWKSGREQLMMQHPKGVMPWIFTNSKWKKVSRQFLSRPWEKLTYLSILSAPTLAEMRLQLTESGLSVNGRDGSVAWLVEGINIEEVQWAFFIYQPYISSG